MGPYDNDRQEYLEDKGVETGLWLVQDPDSDLFDDNSGYLCILPNEEHGIAENLGPDHVSYVNGPYAGQNMADVLDGQTKSELDPHKWEVDWEALGFIIVDGPLKRFNPQDGYYHA